MMITETFKQDFNRISYQYPLLKYREVDTHYVIYGTLEVFDKDGYKWGEFEIEIAISKDYPHGFPVMRETQDKITPLNSKHINSNKTLCTCVEPKMYIEKKRGINLSRFIEQYALSFLAAHIYYEKSGKYPAGEYSHGNIGIKEFYQNILLSKDDKIIIFWLNIVIEQKSLLRNLLCKCGSGVKYKKCHLLKLNDLRLIPKDVLKEHLELFKD